MSSIMPTTTVRPDCALSHGDEEALMKKADAAMKNTSNPLEKLRYFCLTKGATGILGLRRLFRTLDEDGDKKLSRDEFSRGLVEAGCQLTKAEADAIFVKFDTDKSGTLNLEEFIVGVRPPMNESRRKVVLSAFRKLDKSGDGEVTVDDVRGVYSVHHHPQFINGECSEKQILEKFLQNFEASGHTDGKVTEQEFVDYYAGLSASIDNDAYFDLVIRNAWGL